MGEILSQSEIDAILSALNSGEISLEEKADEGFHKLKKYDFKRPNKFSKEHIKKLEMIHDNFSRIAAGYLTTILRTTIQIKVLSSEQITYEEFLHSVSNPTILITYSLKPFDGLFMLETGPQFTYQVLDIMLGGDGKSNIKTREFTEIEKNIIKRVNIKLLEGLKMAWEDIMGVEAVFESLETNPVLNQIFSPNEPVALITMKVIINGVQSYINMCIPYISIERNIDKLVLQYKSGLRNKIDRTTYQKIESNIKSAKVNTYVELGKTIITIEDFLNLGIGDCIKLCTKVNTPLDYYVEDKPYFKVYPGSIGNKMGVQIIDVIKDGGLRT